MIEPSERLNEWMDGYVHAWTTNSPDAIAELFTADAVYDPQTAGGEWDGIDEIIERWIEIDDDPENWDFQWLPIVETDDIAVIVGRTHYHEPPMSYRNLFVIHLDNEGKCTDFTEWYIEEEQA